MIDEHINEADHLRPSLALSEPRSNWIEIRTAYLVCQLGTVSAAAEHMGVHRSTVIRRIDTLEASLRQKLFQRHNKGYTPTELGLELRYLADEAENAFRTFVGKARTCKNDLSGEFIVTCREVASSMIMPVLTTFAEKHPSIILRFTQGNKFPKLEFGESHISVRIGKHDEHPDYVYKYFTDMKFGLFASRQYASRFGIPESKSDVHNHRFVCYVAAKPFSFLPIHTWIEENVPSKNIVFSSDSPLALDQAMLSGVGIGLYPLHLAKQRDDLVKVWAPWPEWTAPIWIVTHVDLHKTVKVQAFLKQLQEYAAPGRCAN